MLAIGTIAALHTPNASIDPNPLKSALREQDLFVRRPFIAPCGFSSGSKLRGLVGRADRASTHTVEGVMRAQSGTLPPYQRPRSKSGRDVISLKKG